MKNVILLIVLVSVLSCSSYRPKTPSLEEYKVFYSDVYDKNKDDMSAGAESDFRNQLYHFRAKEQGGKQCVSELFAKEEVKRELWVTSKSYLAIKISLFSEWRGFSEEEGQMAFNHDRLKDIVMVFIRAQGSSGCVYYREVGPTVVIN